MHELAVCQALADQVQKHAHSNGALRVATVVVGIGPLSGVEPALLQQAWPLGSVGTLAEKAALEIQNLPVRVKCQQCEQESDALPNRLLCEHCGSWKTRLVSGDELLLLSLELINEQRSDSCVTPAVAT